MLMPVSQGRLPIRVELKALEEEELYRILKEPEANLIRQQIELLKTGSSLSFSLCVCGKACQEFLSWCCFFPITLS